MSADDLGRLNSELPNVFDPKPLPPGWDDDWHVIHVDSPDKPGIDELEQLTSEDAWDSIDEPNYPVREDGIGTPPLP